MKRVVFLVLIFLSVRLIAQVYNANNFYLFNQTLFNPAATSIDEGLHIFTDFKDQWTGYQNAPETGYFGFSAMAKNTGWGANAYYDRSGLFRSFGLSGLASYRIELNPEQYFHLGANIAFKQNFLKISDIENADPNDPAIPSNKFFETIIHAGFGLSYTTKQFNFSVSVPDFYSTVTNKFLQNVFVFVSYQIGEENYYKHNYIKPFAFFHYIAPNLYTGEMGIDIKFNDKFQTFIIARSNMSLIGGVLLRIYNFYFGYTYEANYGYRNYLRLSSHEITIRFSDKYFFKSY